MDALLQVKGTHICEIELNKTIAIVVHRVSVDCRCRPTEYEKPSAVLSIPTLETQGPRVMSD
jgi:hypothetical protein